MMENDAGSFIPGFAEMVPSKMAAATPSFAADVPARHTRFPRGATLLCGEAMAFAAGGSKGT
jgi:hypothetical protein